MAAAQGSLAARALVHLSGRRRRVPRLRCRGGPPATIPPRRGGGVRPQSHADEREDADSGAARLFSDLPEADIEAFVGTLDLIISRVRSRIAFEERKPD